MGLLDRKPDNTSMGDRSLKWDADRLEALTASIYQQASVARLPELEAALAAWKESDSPRDHAVRGSGWLVAFKLSHRPEWLDRALLHLRQAHDLEPTPARAANLASALLEWGWLPQRTDLGELLDAHTRAVRLLREALSGTGNDEPGWVTRATTLLSAYIDQVELQLPDTDVDQIVDFGDSLLLAARRHGLGFGEPANLMGGLLIILADLEHPRADLDRAIELLSEALETLPQDHPDRAARLSNLGAAFMDRSERTGWLQDITEAVRLQRAAFDVAAPNDLNRPLIASNLLNALVADLESSGDATVAEEAAGLVPLLLDAFGPGHPRRPVLLSNTALALRLLGALRSDSDSVDQAVALQREAVQLTPASDPALPGRLASLSLALGERYHQAGSPADLQAALKAGEEAAALPGAGAHEVPGFDSNLGNLRHDRFLLTGSLADLQAAGDLHRRGLDSVPDTHPLTSALRNNAGIVFSDRYDRLGDPADLAAAIEALELSLEATSQPRLRAGREINLAVALDRRFRRTGAAADLRRSTDLLQQAREKAHAFGDQQVEATAVGALIDNLRLRWEQLDDEDAALRLRQLLSFSSEDLPGDRPARQLRRAVLQRLMGAGDTAGDLQAVIESGLRSRPGVALAAAKQLAHDALAARLRGDRGAGVVAAEAAEGARRALDVLLVENRDQREEVAWRRDAQGIAALTAQVALLDEDLDVALTAFGAGHAVLLARQLEQPDLARVAAPEDTITAWATPFGGGAVISHDGKPAASVSLPLVRTDRVARWVDRLALSARIGTGSLQAVLNRTLAEMATAFEPIWPQLRPDVPLLWCGGGQLAALPFAAVQRDGVAIGQRRAVRQAPTAEIAAWSTGQAARRPLNQAESWSVAAAAGSKYRPLPGALREAGAFAPAARQLLGSEATAEATLATLQRASLFHFAGHAFVSAVDPLANYLLLADDAPLHARTIATTRSQARLAVLSACDTATVGVAHADEALGLASSLHMAGVPGAIATLWPVRDSASAELMKLAAEALRAGAQPADALRRARELAVSRKVPSTTWAAFVLSGA